MERYEYLNSLSLTSEQKAEIRCLGYDQPVVLYSVLQTLSAESVASWLGCDRTELMTTLYGMLTAEEQAIVNRPLPPSPPLGALPPEEMPKHQ